MSRRVSTLALSTLAVAGLVAGCGSPDRPRELSVDDVQACDLLQSSSLTDLGVKAPPESLPVVAGSTEEGATCQYAPVDGGTVAVSTVTSNGIDRWTNGSMESTTPVEKPRIQGYRTIKASKKHLSEAPHDMCALYVDVAGGQALRVEAGPTDDDEPPSCEIARQFAEPAVQSLSELTV